MKFMPARSQMNDNLIADLDTLIDETVSLRLHGKTHTLNQITTIVFLKYTNRLAILNSCISNKNISEEELLDAYYELINSICETITIEDIKKAQSSQLAALLQLVIDKVMGRLTESKKKTLMTSQKTSHEE